MIAQKLLVHGDKYSETELRTWYDLLQIFEHTEDNIKRYPGIIKYIPSELQLDHIKKCPAAIQFMENPDLEIQLVAVDSDHKLIKYIENPDPKVVKLASEKESFAQLHAMYRFMLEMFDRYIDPDVDGGLPDFVVDEGWNEDNPEEYVTEDKIELCMEQIEDATREQVIAALQEYRGDLVGAIMSLS